MKKYSIKNYKNIQHNFEVIKKIVEKYKDVLIEKQGEIMERFGVCKSKDYINFMYSLSDDEYLGNLFNGLFNNQSIELYEKVLNDEMSIDDLFNMSF